jgi:glycosyltransferase involved in cell wall biosynthesis
LKIAHFYQEGGIRFCEPQAAQLHIYHTLRGLQQAGHEAALVALQGRRVLCTQDLRVFQVECLPSEHDARLGLSGAAPFQAVESGIRRLQSELRLPYLALFDSIRMAEAGSRNLRGIDLIHERFNLLALGGAWASKRLGVPFILEVNADLLEQRKFKGIPEKGLRRLYAQWATRACFNAADRIVCISAGLRDHLKQKWNLEPGKLAVLPCAADVEVFGNGHNAEHVRRGLGLTTEPVIMWVGGFFPWHDLDLLVESFSEAVQRHPSARLVLVGDGQTRPAVERKVRDRGLERAVILTGPVAHSRVPELLAAADLAVAPAAPVPASRGGTGTPLKLFEYMAAGKAVVATALNQAAEVIRDGQTGLLVEAGDAHGFAEAMLGLLSDPAARARLGQNARRHAVEQFSWEQYTRRLEEIYRGALGQRRPAPRPA